MQYTVFHYMYIDTWFSLFQIDKLPDEVRRELQSRQGTESFVLTYYLFWIDIGQSELGIIADEGMATTIRVPIVKQIKNYS